MPYIDDIQLMLYALNQDGDWIPDLDHPNSSQVIELLQRQLPDLDMSDPDWALNAAEALAAQVSVDIEARGLLLNRGTAINALESDTLDTISTPIFNDLEAQYLREMLVALTPEYENSLENSDSHDATLDRILGRFLKENFSLPEATDSQSIRLTSPAEMLALAKQNALDGDPRILKNTITSTLAQSVYRDAEAMQRLEESAPQVHAWILDQAEKFPFLYEEASLQNQETPDLGSATKIADAGELSKGFQTAAFNPADAPAAPDTAIEPTGQKLVT